MEVRDLGLAAAILACGFPLRSVIGHDTNAVFSFEPTRELEEVIDKFHTRQLRVDAATYSEAMRSLKAAAMAARRQAVRART